MTLSRGALLVAAGAARRWPRGRATNLWFLDDALETLIYCGEFSVKAARRAGDPAICVAAFRAHLRGRDFITWREVFSAQAELIELVAPEGILEYNLFLSQNPELLAQVFHRLASEVDHAKTK